MLGDLLGGGIKGILEGVRGIVTLFKLPPEQEAQMALALQSAEQQLQQAVLAAQSEIIVAEAKGESWIQRSWRPLLMLSITGILVNNYMVYPYLSLFGVPTAVLDFPDKLWNLLTLGVSGYIVGRSGEKLMKTWKASE